MNLKSFNIPLFLVLSLIVFCFTIITQVTPVEKIQAENWPTTTFLPLGQIQIETKSHFTSKISESRQKIPFKVIFQKDPNLAWGQILKGQNGVAGVNLKITEILFWKGKEVERKTFHKLISEPQHQINLIGAKLTPGEIETPAGKLAYKGKMKVFATSYDKNCAGCNETTATGSKLSYGIVAVDPTIIPLGSKVYVSGYGTALAADTGGAIKGARIDLAFENVKNGFWRSRWTEVYLLE